MSYIGLTPDEERRMLGEIGVGEFEDLLEAIPRKARLGRALEIDGPYSEIELRRLFGRWSNENDASRSVSFMGGGAYDHYIPAALNVVASRSEFVTAYTPYQPEVAQGSLQAIFEFQSMIAELTGMDVANASLYDGATALVEAALLARSSTRRDRVVVAGALHPHYVDVLRTYLGAEHVTVVAPSGGQCAPEELKSAMRDDVACVVYQHPNFFGLLESPRAIHTIAHEGGALAVACVDPFAMVLLEPPGAGGDASADIAVGEGQVLGNPPSFGGPMLGFFSCRKALTRRMPGRIAGQTVDQDGKRGFVLTLQTREQHIRREKATSNICTNQGLLALRATMYMGLLGKRGMREVAESCVQKTHHAAELAADLDGYEMLHGGAFFREFALRCPVPAAAVIEAGRGRGILPGIDLGRFSSDWKNALLVTVTEQRSAEEIERWAEVLKEAAGGAS